MLINSWIIETAERYKKEYPGHEWEPEDRLLFAGKEGIYLGEIAGVTIASLNPVPCMLWAKWIQLALPEILELCLFIPRQSDYMNKLFEIKNRGYEYTLHSQQMVYKKIPEQDPDRPGEVKFTYEWLADTPSDAWYKEIDGDKNVKKRSN